MFVGPRLKFVVVLAVALLAAVGMLVGCSDVDGEGFEGSPDGEGDTAFVDGKADQLFGDCHLEHILLLVNDPEIESQRLKDEGVHTRAARNIVEHRAGSDGVLGSDEDVFFRSVEEIDDVYFVGPVAIQQLVDAVDVYCADGPWREADSIFSPRPYHDSHIDRVVDEIESAERSIDMAMYSISDNRAITAIGDAVARGVTVRLLFNGANGDHLNTPGSRSAQLEDLGVDVRYINRIMHHKFAIIDGPQEDLLKASTARFFSGSGNLSFGAATRYDENTTFHQGDPALVLTMQREFNHLWENSRDLEWNEELEYFETLPIEEEMIPPRDDLEVLLTSENFETTYSNRWGAGFRPISFSEVVATRLVELIEEANSSIYVAAGFLRSRAVSEAIMRRWSEDPDLDIRIYLDQSEYISEWYHNSQLSDLEDCLSDAGEDQSDIYDCRERGFIYAYQLHEQDIPVRFKNYSYRWHYSYALQMHHKYMIFDRHTVATGSYNFSNNAEQNTMENVIVYRSPFYPDVVEGFVDNFETIWETGRDEGRFEALIEEIDTSDEIDLIFEPAALSWEEVTEVRQRIRDRCPEVNSEPFRTRPEDHRSCSAE